MGGGQRERQREKERESRRERERETNAQRGEFPNEWKKLKVKRYQHSHLHVERWEVEGEKRMGRAEVEEQYDDKRSKSSNTTTRIRTDTG